MCKSFHLLSKNVTAEYLSVLPHLKVKIFFIFGGVTKMKFWTGGEFLDTL